MISVEIRAAHSIAGTKPAKTMRTLAVTASTSPARRSQSSGTEKAEMQQETILEHTIGRTGGVAEGGRQKASGAVPGAFSIWQDGSHGPLGTGVSGGTSKNKKSRCEIT